MRAEPCPFNEMSQSVIVPQSAMTMECSLSMSIMRSFEDIPVIFAQVREVTVKIVAEPGSSTAMESAILKLSHVFPQTAIPFASKSSVKVVKIECCSLTICLVSRKSPTYAQKLRTLMCQGKQKGPDTHLFQ